MWLQYNPPPKAAGKFLECLFEGLTRDSCAQMVVPIIVDREFSPSCCSRSGVEIILAGSVAEKSLLMSLAGIPLSRCCKRRTYQLEDLGRKAKNVS